MADQAKKQRFVDLTGKRFGRLAVFSRAPNNKYGSAQWNCICDCGNQVIVAGNRLTCGGTTSCGCYAKELQSQRFSKEFNTYYIQDHIAHIILTNGKECLIDEEDINLVSSYRWTMSEKHGYVTAYNKQKRANTKSITIKIHRLIMNCLDDENLVVDHIDGNRLNNCKNNLRICSQQDNNKNKKLYKNNSSGHTGVSFRKDLNTWYAFISLNGVTHKLGSFKTIEEAIQAYKNASQAHYGDFSKFANKEGGSK